MARSLNGEVLMMHAVKQVNYYSEFTSGANHRQNTECRIWNTELEWIEIDVVYRVRYVFTLLSPVYFVDL